MKMNDLRNAFATNSRMKEWHEEAFFKGFATAKQLEKLLAEGILESKKEKIWTTKSGLQLKTFYRAKEGK